MKITLWGDLHVGRLSKMLGDEDGLRLHRRLFSALLAKTRRIGSRYVAILGDLFNSPHPSTDELLLVIEALAEADDMSMIVMLGNHDIYDAITNSLKLLRRLPRVGALTHVTFVEKPRVLEWAKLRVLVLPYGGVVPEQVDADLVLFHDAVVGAKRDNGHPVSLGEGLSPSVFRGVTAVGGHLHTYQPPLFPGTQAQMSFGESSDKRFCWLEDDGKTLRLKSRAFDPPWILETVDWSTDDPPACDETDVYYRLRVGDERPGPRWMVEHPQVIQQVGGSKRVASEATKKISLLVGGQVGNKSEQELLASWMRQFSPLDQLSRMRALRLHDKMAGGER